MPLEPELAAKISEAIKNQDVATVGHTLINYKGNFRSYPPLHIACGEGLVEAAKLLLTLRGIGINDKKGPILSTPLNLASSQGHIEIVRLLVQLEAIDLNAADTEGFSPLYLAASHGYLEIVRLLVEHGADINQKEFEHSMTPLIIACVGGHVDVISYLLDQPGLEINHKIKVTNPNNLQSLLEGTTTAYSAATAGCPQWLLDKFKTKGVDLELERKLDKQREQLFQMVEQQNGQQPTSYGTTLRSILTSEIHAKVSVSNPRPSEPLAKFKYGNKIHTALNEEIHAKIPADSRVYIMPNPQQQSLNNSNSVTLDERVKQAQTKESNKELEFQLNEREELKRKKAEIREKYANKRNEALNSFINEIESISSKKDKNKCVCM